ncbi:MAG: biopolymer transporter ExbD [Gammaproteobacteria bacterium]|nr:MAG: biopolymer transporter ExbD [Gammaproteobacteria bacterium]
MKFRRRRRNEVSIELTPLIDVVFLLLIFFMVSTTFIRETQLELELPEASGELQQPEEQSIVITIAQDGTYAVNDQALVNNQLATLMRALRQQIGEGDASPQLIITADANATHQAVVRAMDAAGQLGLTRLSLTTQSPEEEP